MRLRSLQTHKFPAKIMANAIIFIAIFNIGFKQFDKPMASYSFFSQLISVFKLFEVLYGFVFQYILRFHGFFAVCMENIKLMRKLNQNEYKNPKKPYSFENNIIFRANLVPL